MKLEITADKVKEAAAKCPQAEATLKTLFPEVFEDARHFHFTNEFLLDTNSMKEPFFIGQHLAPNELIHKCLIVHPNWEIVLSKKGAYNILIPQKK